MVEFDVVTCYMLRMNTIEAAKSLEKLGHPTRLEIIQLLVRAGDKGISVGTIQQKLDVPPSTLSHHISHLVAGGLVSQVREGRTLYCSANYQRLEEIVTMLTENCCAGIEVVPATAA